MCDLNICDLPLELIVHILNFLSYEEACKTISVCNHFEQGVCYIFKLALPNLRRRLQTHINNLLIKIDDMPLNEEYLRLDFIKLLTFFRYLLTEMDIIYALIWRYQSVNRVWSILCPSLAPVIEEFSRNIDQQISLEARNLGLNVQIFRTIFPEWHAFLTNYDNELNAKLNALMPTVVDFEIAAIDILTCCPSINFQIAFKRIADRNDTFNIYSFFKMNHLKPACQIPNVHNSELTTRDKQMKLLTFLRECIQWENMVHLQEFFNEILDLETRLWILFDETTRNDLISQLNKLYTNIKSTSPYAPIYRSTRLSFYKMDTYYNEYYCRFNTYNENFTGLRCIVNTMDQKIDSLPLIFTSFRGWTRNSLHDIVNVRDHIKFDDIGSHYNILPYQKKHRINKKPKFQLVILYRERLFSTPAEATINLTYDENKDCHINMHLIESEPFTL